MQDTVERELDYLGLLLQITIRFWNTQFNQTMEVNDPICQEETTTGKMFSKEDGRWFMRGDSLPGGDTSVKAIAVDDEGIYVELSPLDVERLPDVLEQCQYFVHYDEGNRTIHGEDGTDWKISVSEPTRPLEGMEERILCTILFKDIWSQESRAIVIEAIDIIYSSGCFLETEADEDEVIFAPPPAPTIGIKQSLHLQQKLRQEQRPLLSLRQGVADQMKTRINMSLRVLHALDRRIRSAESEEALLALATQLAEERGLTETYKVLVFSLAGQIRAARPNLTWRQARKLAREMAAEKK